MKKETKYNKIEVLKGLEAIRKKTSMYLGNTENGDALFHSFIEILDNCIDEYIAGACNKISIILYKDGSCSIEDNGRGCPCYYMEEEKEHSLVVIFSKLHAGGKFTSENYDKGTIGTHGIGSSATNATSSRFRVITRRDGKECSLAFAKGKLVEKVSESPTKKPSGTFIRFVPDKTIFKNITEFEPERIKNKLLEISYLCPNLLIVFENENNKEKITYTGGQGLNDFVRYLSGEKSLAHAPINIKGEQDKISVEISLSWNDDEEEVGRYYTNNVPNPEGGSHAIGFKSGLTRAINSYINNADLPRTLKINLSGDDIREGLIAVLNLKHPDPKYSSQTKQKLVVDDVRPIVESIVNTQISKYFEDNPKIAKEIITRCVNNYKAREASRKAKELSKKANVVASEDKFELAGKIADCQEKDPMKRELYICEGISASGALKSARDRKNQSILPLRGKVLNVEKLELKRVLDNEELFLLIQVLGCGIGKNFDISKLRYGKIIICTDRDNDGAHIYLLLLVFLFRQMPQLILNGNVYIARAPLYRVDYRNNIYYLGNDRDLKQFIKEKKISNNTLKLQRFKGLGEMNASQLEQTITNPKMRRIDKIVVENFIEVDKYFSIFMGSNVEIRKNYIMDNSHLGKNLDV